MFASGIKDWAITYLTERTVGAVGVQYWTPQDGKKSETAREPVSQNLSVVLEQQLNEVQSLKSLVLAMHETLKLLDPKYGTEVLKVLEDQRAQTHSPDAAALAFAKRTLVTLRSL